MTEEDRMQNVPEEHRFISNADSLRWRLSQAFNELDSDEMKVTKAKELANIGGKLINSAKTQCEYYALRKETPVISFLECK